MHTMIPNTTSNTTMKPVELTEDQKKQLFSLSALARQARGAYYAPEIEQASRELSALLSKYLHEGYTYKQLSEATGLQWRSIKARLFRHGYLDNVPPSQQHKVFQGSKKPGPTCNHNPERFRTRSIKNGKSIHIECLECRRNKRLAKQQDNKQYQKAS